MSFRYERPKLVVLSDISKTGADDQEAHLAWGAPNSCSTGSLKTGFPCTSIGAVPALSTCTVGTYPGGRQCDAGGVASTHCTAGTGATM